MHRPWMYHLLVVVAAALALFPPARAEAHALGLSQSELVLDGASVRARIVFARGEAQLLARGGRESDVADLVARGVEVTVDGDACAPRLDDAAIVEGDGLAIDATFTCPHGARALAATLYFLGELPAGHRHLARLVAGDATAEATLDADHRAIALDTGAPRPAFVRDVASTFPMGVRHILTGWDHLLFLVALLLGAERRVRRLALVVTAFTVAHAVTLAAATLGVVTLSSSIVEPAIAASIAIVGLENLGAAPRVPRPLTAFVFGLVHGLGFASALRDLALPRDRLAASLVGFNAGVEAGQLAVVLLLGAAFAAMARRVSPTRAPRVASLAVALVGAGLCLERVGALLR